MYMKLLTGLVPRRSLVYTFRISRLPLIPYQFRIPRYYSAKADKIKVTFKRFNGEQISVYGKEGDSLLDVIVNNNLDFDGFGACEGTLTCSTCHVILKPEDFDKLPSKPTDEELDMLDLAFDLTDTSRLGCQIILSKDLDGLTVQVPATVNDARSS